MCGFRRFVPALVFVIAAFATRAAYGQGAPNAHHAPTTSGAQAASGPTLQRSAVGVRVAKDAPAKTAPRFAHTDKNVALMIVGGSAFVLGAFIKDTPGAIVMTAGVVTGLYGLYKYLE